MAKTCGGIRGGSGSRSFQSDARSMFSNIESGYGRQRDYSSYQTKKLQSLQRIGRSYSPSEREQAIQAYTSYANRVTGGSYRSIEHASLEGARSELVNTANRAAVYRDLNAITEELRRRRRR